MSDVLRVLADIDRDGAQAIAAPAPEEKFKLFEEADTENMMTSSRGNSVEEEWMKYIRPGHSPNAPEFDVKSEKYTLFRCQDYNWKEHGFSLLSRYYSEVAPLIDDLFHYTYNMTDSTFNQISINTTPFRRAIWHYVHRVKGIEHDDFNYREINLMLKRNIKVFLKKLSCMPFTVTLHDFKSLTPVFRLDEVCHIVLLATEARKQADLLYALRALTNYLKLQQQ